jgi:hypothetical protein
MPSSFSAERFVQGMTFDEYVAYMATPANLQRAGNRGPRRDFSDHYRESFEQARLTEDQEAALRCLVAQPSGPAHMLVIAEEWSTDCQRDVPTYARIAAVAGLDLRIVPRDGQEYDVPASEPDIMADFLLHRNGEACRTIPICAFYTRDFEYLYHFTELPGIYDKDRLVRQRIRPYRPGETVPEAWARAEREVRELQQSPFGRIWASATVNEIVCGLHRRLVPGAG